MTHREADRRWHTPHIPLIKRWHTMQVRKRCHTCRRLRDNDEFLIRQSIGKARVVDICLSCRCVLWQYPNNPDEADGYPGDHN